MANAIYWDTSALIKLYAPTPDSSAYLRLLVQQPEDLAICFLHRVELYFALRRKESRGEIAVGSAAQLFQLFEQHVSTGRYYVIPWGDNVALAARQLVDTSSSAVPPVMLRSLDGLHLGALRAAKIQSVVTADIRMREAAQIYGTGIIDP